jgi:protein-tyrosine phosphatase
MIRGLEANLITYDISDPFGGSLEIYRETLKELEKYIDLLIKKIQ